MPDNILEKCKISNLWHSKNVEIKFNDTVNFLIGPNGSGKTTLINLIVAALSADIKALLLVPFTKIELILKAISKRIKPIIEVEKKIDKKSGSIQIMFKLRETTTGPIDLYVLDDVDDMLRYYTVRRRRRLPPDHIPGTQSLKEKFDLIFNLSWLSIHRSRSFRRLEDEESYDSTVDSKLADLSNEFVRFFSSLSQQSSNELTKFQESVFVSMFMTREKSWFAASYQKMNLESEKNALIEIFKELNVGPDKYLKKVESHFSSLKRATKKLEGQDKITVTPDEFATFVTNVRVDYVVREWNKLRKKQEEIFEPKETFLKVLNSLVRGKKFFINSKNELTVELNESVPLALHRLSSGEKQMIIILGEALLQYQSPSIYIADEPELSLHIDWQQSLIDNIRGINPASQIIFATHSPDIVGNYSSNVIDVEEIIK